MREKEKGDFMGEITRTEGQEMTREGKKLRRKTTEHNLVESFRKKKRSGNGGLKQRQFGSRSAGISLFLLFSNQQLYHPNYNH